MASEVVYLERSFEEVEALADKLLQNYASHVQVPPITPPIPIEDIAEHYLGYSSLRGNCVITDPVTNKTVSLKSDYGFDITPVLLDFLKKRVPDMNVVGFFVAGSGKSGKVKPDTLRYAIDGWQYEYGKSDKILAAL